MDGARLPSLGPRGEGWVALQGVVFVAIAAAGMLGPAWGGPWRTVALAVGTCAITVGLACTGLGLAGLRENLTALPRPVEGGRIVEDGIYGLVRHPIYSGLVLGGLGWGLVTASPAALLAAVFLGCFFDVKSRREEAWLLDAYPGYAAYRARVRKLVPFVY